MKTEQAMLLATACLEVLNELDGVGSAQQVHQKLQARIELCRSVPVTMATVSRSLRSLVRVRRVFPAPVEDNMGRFSLKPIPRKELLHGKPEHPEPNIATVEPKPPVTELKSALRMLPASFPNGQIWGHSEILHRVSSVPVESGRLGSDEVASESNVVGTDV